MENFDRNPEFEGVDGSVDSDSVSGLFKRVVVCALAIILALLGVSGYLGWVAFGH